MRMLDVLRSRRLAASTVMLVVAILAGSTRPAGAQTPADETAFFKGKTVRILVGSPPGGGYDLVARMLAPHMGRRLGATVVVENKPGASALLALSYMLVQPPDGLVMMMASAEAAIMSELLSREGVNWSVTKLNWIAKVASAPKLWFVGANSRITSAADAIRAEQVVWPATGPADNISDVAAVLSHVIGLKSKIVVGYKGAGDMSLAVIRGEADTGVLSIDSAIKLVESGQLRPLAILDTRRWPGLPNVPTLDEAARVDPAKAWMQLLRNEIGEVQRALVAAPNVPATRVAFLRTIAAQILTDPDVIAEGKRTGRDIDFMAGAELQKHISELMGRAAPRIPQMRTVMLETYFQGPGR